MPMISERYTGVAVLLHWLMAVLMTLSIVLILTVEQFPEEWARPVVDTHKSLGITLLGLVIMRILWRATHRPPPMPTTYSRLEKIAAHAAHGTLYLLMLALPLSGWMHDSAWKDAASHPMKLFGTVPWPRIGWISGIEPVGKEMLHSLFGAVHAWAGYVLYALVALHVLAALKHQLIDRERELQRMLP